MINCVYLHVTQRCQLHCSYCYFNANDSLQCPEMRTQELFSALDCLKSMKPKKIVFTGGEPLLRDDLFLIASYAHSFAKTVLATNGLLVTEENKYEILESFDDIRISLDGAKNRHDACRGEGTYEKALSSIKLLGNQCAAAITYTKLDEGHVGELLNNLMKNNVHRVYSSCVREIGRATNNMLPSAKQISAEEADFFGQQSNEDVKGNFHSSESCIGKYISIQPNGDIYPCHILSRPKFCMGNILATDPISILHSPITKRLFRIYQKINPERPDVCIGEKINQYVEDHKFEG